MAGDERMKRFKQMTTMLSVPWSFSHKTYRGQPLDRLLTPEDRVQGPIEGTS
eukprot:m.90672 g.90672  ORF g.90672 m.90672 type:complete len:52 (-) comp15014_c0_seq5:148-303(-)